DAFENFDVGPGRDHHVPAHVRYAQWLTLLGMEPDDSRVQPTEARSASLFAGSGHQLGTQADAQDRLCVQPDEFVEQFRQAEALQVVDRLVERTDAWKHELVGCAQYL